MLNTSPIIKAIKGLTADSRTVQPGYLFAALPGAKNDGREFIADAIARGATHILCHPGRSWDDSIVWIESSNPRADFARLAAAFYNAQPETVFAVTGTNGKTSTVNILRQLWEGLGYNAAAIGTLGVTGTGYAQEGALTTPDPVKLHEIFVALKAHDIHHVAMEASSHGIDQERLAGTRITAGIFTNLTRDHLDYHGTMENYFAAKARLFTELLPDNAPAAINADDTYGQRLIEMCRNRLRVCSFGTQDADLQMTHYTAHADGFDVQIEWKNQTHHMHLPLLGKFQIWNTLGALGALLMSGERMEKLLPQVAKLRPVRGRLEVVGRTAHGAPVFVDYAHTPDALETVLNAVREHASGEVVVVFGCGGNRDRGKRPQMAAIASRLAARVIVTDDNPRNEDAAAIRAEVMAGAGHNAREIGDRRTAIHTAIAELGRGDILVIAGKGHEQGQIIGDTVIPFDDASVAREFLGMGHEV